MEMHQAGRRADWASVAGGQRTMWQHVAARTNGVITPGNIISVTGLVFVLTGIYMIAQNQYVAGLVWMGLGRLADIADGVVAHKTGTKSPLGEAVDAAIDKIELFVALIGLLLVGLLPLSYVAAIALLNGSIAVVSVVAKAKGYTLHPIRSGKVATFLLWLATALIVSAAIIDSMILSLAGSTIIVGACLLTAIALVKYVICMAEMDKQLTRTEE